MCYRYHININEYLSSYSLHSVYVADTVRSMQASATTTDADAADTTLASTASTPLILRPFIVDNKNDQMCFALYGLSTTALSQDISSLFAYTMAVPSALKIETALYDYVKDDTIDLQDLLVVSFLTNTAMHQDIDALNADVLYAAASRLQSYPTESFESFFWSSTQAQSFFASARSQDISSSSRQDSATAAAWRSRAATMSAISNATEGSMSDPCDFKSLQIEKHQVSPPHHLIPRGISHSLKMNNLFLHVPLQLLCRVISRSPWSVSRRYLNQFNPAVSH